MKNNKEKANTLIKRNNLLSFMKSKGIERISPKAINKIEQLIKKVLEDNIEEIKERAFVDGRKTIKPKDIELNVLKKEKYPEI